MCRKSANLNFYASVNQMFAQKDNVTLNIITIFGS